MRLILSFIFFLASNLSFADFDQNHGCLELINTESEKINSRLVFLFDSNIAKNNEAEDINKNIFTTIASVVILSSIISSWHDPNDQMALQLNKDPNYMHLMNGSYASIISVMVSQIE